MNFLKNIINKYKITLSLPHSFIFIALGILFILLGVTIVSPQFFKIFWHFAFENPILILINILPIIVLVTVLFFSFGNAVFSIMLSGVFFALAAIANAEKMRLRQAPLYPYDVTLLTELVGIAKGFTPNLLFLYGAIMVIAILVIIASLVLFKTKPIDKKIRVFGTVTAILVAIFSNTLIYSSNSLYSKFPVDGNPYFEINQYGSKGFIYSFCYKFNSMKVTEPEGYDKYAIQGMENLFVNNYDEYKDTKLPHIIMIMGEAYSDLSVNKNLDFSGYTDPMENWKEITKSNSSISGHIIVPNFGGGTSDTEFDVLTALPTRYIDNASNSYSLIGKNLDAIPWQLKNIGYDTLAIHPGYSWFYNRLNVFSYLGFDDFIHLENFQGSEKYSGGYIADKYATDCIIDTFEEHIKISDSPLFQFTVTIQNHGPYDDKYNDIENMFETDVKLTDNEKNLLNSYFMGIRDADKEIRRLTDYFETSSEPVVFVYFGDHLPGFSNGMEFFDILDYNINANGTTEELLNVYKTPFVVWQNSASKELFSLENNAKAIDFENNIIISSNFLGSSVLELSGINGLSPVLDFSNQLRKNVNIITAQKFLLPNGEYVSSLDEDLHAKTNTLRHIVYYKMFDE